jgi:hypothetical protein
VGPPAAMMRWWLESVQLNVLALANVLPQRSGADEQHTTVLVDGVEQSCSRRPKPGG